MSRSSSEEIVWTGHPSHLINLSVYLAGLLIIPLPWVIWRWLELRSRRYELTTQRLRTISGVLNRNEDELELYRVKDITLQQPLHLRLFGLGNVTLHTSDKTTPELVIPAIPNARQVRDQVRNLVEKRRDEKRVREIDFE